MPESSRIQVRRFSGCFPESKEQSLNFGCSFEACDEPREVVANEGFRAPDCASWKPSLSDIFRVDYLCAIDERRCCRRACVELVGADNDFDGMYSSPLDRAIALARGLGSVAAALWQRGHVGIVAMCLLRRCACVSVLICLIRINVHWRPHACGSKTTLSRLVKRRLNVMMT